MTDLEHQEQVIADSKLIAWRNRVDIPRVRQAVFEHKQEMGREGEWLRIFALQEQIEIIEKELRETVSGYDERKQNLMAGAMIADRVKRLLSEQDKLDREFYFLLSKGLPSSESKKRQKPITPDMVERAKEFPIDTLLDVRRGYATCLFHADKRPSMYVKGNFAHCFSCGKTADTIDIYRKIHGATFPEAVRALQ